MVMMCVDSSFRKLDSEREERRRGHGGGGLWPKGCRFTAMFFKLGSLKVFSVHQT